jgi:ornithine cyclodeaminase/alanine dehydrogenase-like protein (mu-crystallin family)
MIGTGAQAGGIAAAVCRVREIRCIKAYSIEPEDRRSRFAHEVEQRTGVPVTLTGSAEEAVRGSDIVALATSARSPVISGSWLAPGTHVNAIGNHYPDSREVDSDTVKKSIVVCDDVASCMQEAGDIILPIKNGEIPSDHVRYSLAEVVAGRGPARGADDITLFKSVGLSIQDVSTALYAYTEAVTSGIGVEVDLT